MDPSTKITIETAVKLLRSAARYEEDNPVLSARYGLLAFLAERAHDNDDWQNFGPRERA